MQTENAMYCQKLIDVEIIKKKNMSCTDHTGFILLLSIDVVPKLEHHILLTEREFNEKFEDFILQSFLHDLLTNNFMAYEI